LILVDEELINYVGVNELNGVYKDRAFIEKWCTVISKEEESMSKAEFKSLAGLKLGGKSYFGFVV